ncbi:uncharacterized protein [Montipora capricornis]|uniref:uncharacterized protein n=1 Tax=Montipora capricornis TaxID=246305 RepID=UPI0035F155A5
MHECFPDRKCEALESVDMSKSLANLCMFCIANNLQNINRVGTFLSKNDNEVLLELLCDHDMFTEHNLPYIGYQLLTSRLENIAFCYSSQVNDTLLQCLAQSGCELKSFILKDCTRVSDKGFSSLLKTQMELELLHLKFGSAHVSLTDKCLAVLRSPKLASVKLEGIDQVTNNGIITLVKNCPSICELMVPRCNLLTDGCFQTVTTLLNGRLEVLDISGLPLLTDLTLSAIGSGSCPKLRELKLDGCTMISGLGLQQVTQGCRQLSALDIGYCYRILRKGTLSVGADAFPTNLTELTLHGVQMSASLLTELVAQLAHIRVLTLCGMMAVDDDTLDKICLAVGQTLTSLDLSGCSALTDYGLSTISKHCQVIDSLKVSFCPNITGKKLKPLFKCPQRGPDFKTFVANGCKMFSVDLIAEIAAHCPSLHSLRLAGMKEVDDELLTAVAENCRQLSTVSIKGCGLVSDVGICELARMCPLEEIVISGVSRLTDRSVFALANCCSSTLKELYASGCSMITQAAINYLKDCCLKRIFVEHRTPNVDPDQLMAKNLDTGEFCRADLLLSGPL